MQVTALAVEVEVRPPGGKKWTSIAVQPGTCTFTPAPAFVVTGTTAVTFAGCELASAVPSGSSVRVTSLVQIAGRISGKGNPDGWFSARRTI